MLVIKQEELCHQMQLTIKEFESKLQQMKDTCSNKSKLEAGFEQKMNEIRQDISLLQNELNRWSQKSDETRHNLAQKSETRENFLRLIKKNESKINRLKNDIQQLEKDISERTESYVNF